MQITPVEDGKLASMRVWNLSAYFDALTIDMSPVDIDEYDSRT